MLVPDQQEPEELIIDEAPPAAELEREARMTPAQAVAQMRIRVPARGNRKLRAVLERVNADTELKALWHVSNVNAIARLQINDHSWVHIQIVANIALKLLRQLTKHGIEPSIVDDYGLEPDDAEVALLLGALLHDTGMSVHRDNHEDFSLFLAARKARELLEPSYEEPELTVMVSEVLHEITSHRASGRPLTLEAGILRVVGRARHGEGALAHPVRRRPGVDALALGGGGRQGLHPRRRGEAGADRDHDEQLLRASTRWTAC